MVWAVEGTDQFAEWYRSLGIRAQSQVDFVVGLLEIDGPLLKRPHADTVNGSRFANMKELRVNDPPIRIFYAFDPRRSAILLIGGDKTGDGQFYERMITMADTLYAQHLAHIEEYHAD